MIDPALVEAWVNGWASSRQAPPPIKIPGGFRVDVGSPTQRVRYVLFDADPMMIRRLADSETTPGAFIKVCAEATKVAPSLPTGWVLHEQRYMMVANLKEIIGSSTTTKLPTDYKGGIRTDNSTMVAEIRNESGVLAASGRIALHAAHAIVDDIGTDPEYRRRGLGTAIMGLLTQAALKNGAQVGVLVATPDGHGLYSATGWTVHAPYTSAYNS